MLQRASLLFLLFLLALAGQAAHAADDDKPPAYEPREHYTKYEYRVPVRDGSKLFTAVYAPKDASQRYRDLLEEVDLGQHGQFAIARAGATPS